MVAFWQAPGTLDSPSTIGASPAACSLSRQTPKVGAVCGNTARTDLCGGPPARAVPTATDDTPWLKRINLPLVPGVSENKIEFTVDGKGLVTEVTDAGDKKTNYEYDELERLTRVLEPDPDGAGPQARTIVDYSLNGVGLPIDVTLTSDPQGPLKSTTRFEYDHRYRTTSITENHDGTKPPSRDTNVTTTFQYEPGGLLKQVTYPVDTGTYPSYGLGTSTVQYAYFCFGKCESRLGAGFREP